MLSEVKVPKEMRWSHWTQFKAEEALSHLKKEVFPNLSKLADAEDSFGEYMKSAECKINKPSLLIEACKLIDQMEISQQNQGLDPLPVLPPNQSADLGEGEWKLCMKLKTKKLPDEERRIVAYLDGLQAKVNALPARRSSGRLQSRSGEELSALMASVWDRAFRGEL